MIHVFEGENASEVWQKAFIELSQGKYARHQVGRGGETKELLHVAFTINDPRQRWVVARQPAMNPAFAIADVIWMLSGRRDAAFPNFWNHQLPKFAGHGETYHGAYGFRLRSHFGFDQIERAYQVLKHNPESRQVTLQIWDSRTDFPKETGEPRDQDIPCNVLSILKIRDGRLEWTQINRSNDIFLGVPYNFVQFTTLQEVLAGWLGVEVGSYTHLSDSLHLYDRDAAKVRADPSIPTRPNIDRLALPKEESERMLAELNHRAEIMSKSDLSQSELHDLADTGQLSRAFGNWLLVLVAGAARRRGWIDFFSENGFTVSNPTLEQVLAQWQRRAGPFTPSFHD